MNNIVLIGRLTKSPELKYTQSGKAFTNFSLAVNRTYNREEVDFINCQAWGKTAELIAEYLRKGSKVGIQGRIQVNSSEKNGEKKNYTNVVVENVEFLETNKNSENVKGNVNKVVEDQENEDMFPF